MAATTTPRFWRDPQLPFIEMRSIEDGRRVCYSRHAHKVFSIGAITAGRSTYLHEQGQHTVGTGTVVMMNPGAVHACNPIDDAPWSYIMMYVDAAWLGGIQQACEGREPKGFRPIAALHSRCPALFDGLLALHAALLDPTLEVLAKHEAAIGFFMVMQQALGGAEATAHKPNPRVERAAAYIDAHFTQGITLEQICRAANLSEGYLIRAFQQRYHMTPHAYVVNRRVQHAQAQLRAGAAIAEIAQQAGFADQAHLQRAFKKHLAATPGQYQR
ncbi:AraC family transcriptional regulator [Pseudomonas sp. RIT-PI-S]|uniref:AraC family transcriptional regulator n=1 Tax=Pseudomonas sp. RIT-PI-S TaxID=3035295 RepID=UPI0021D9DEB1|nr:AraC family transcriptional regulator [Pseudomonas sp. RIT-PI-S]